MKNFEFIAKDLTGAPKKGYRQAMSSNDVAGWLRDQGLIAISVKEIAPVLTKKKSITNIKRIKSADLAAVCLQLTTMIEGGVSITTAIATISQDIDNPQLQIVLNEVLEKVEKGEQLSKAISDYPSVFNKLAVALISAGEAGGNLPESLKRLARYYDNRDKLVRKVKGAMSYPCFVLGFIVVIVIFIMAFIIPRFRMIFKQIGGDLPAFTRGFMGVYDFLKNNAIFIVGGILILTIIMVYLNTRTKEGHRFFSRLILSIPLIGKIVSQAFITMFCRTMSTLLGSGVSVLEVFDILSVMASNDVIKDAVVKSKESVIGGTNISLSMAASGFFPNMVIKMVQVGEESGSLSLVLDRTADYYERKVDSTITTVMGLMEPIMIVTVGSIVLCVVLALYLPIFTMSSIAK